MSMTQAEWYSNTRLSSELSEILNQPTMKKAIELLQSLSMASQLDGVSLLEYKNTDTLFGYDVGRNSVFKDLITLTILPSETKQVIPSYKSEL